MPLYIDGEVKSVHYGQDSIKEVYSGSDLVWRSGPSWLVDEDFSDFNDGQRIDARGTWVSTPDSDVGTHVTVRSGVAGVYSRATNQPRARWEEQLPGNDLTMEVTLVRPDLYYNDQPSSIRIGNAVHYAYLQLQGNNVHIGMNMDGPITNLGQIGNIDHQSGDVWTLNRTNSTVSAYRNGELMAQGNHTLPNGNGWRYFYFTGRYRFFIGASDQCSVYYDRIRLAAE